MSGEVISINNLVLGPDGVSAALRRDLHPKRRYTQAQREAIGAQRGYLSDLVRNVEGDVVSVEECGRECIDINIQNGRKVHVIHFPVQYGAIVKRGNRVSAEYISAILLDSAEHKGDSHADRRKLYQRVEMNGGAIDAIRVGIGDTGKIVYGEFSDEVVDFV